MKYRKAIAPYWWDLGTQLLQEEYIYKLDIIRVHHPNAVEKRCIEMFRCWLEVDVEANWNKLIDALEHIQQNAMAARIRRDIFTGKFYYVHSNCMYPLL